MGFSLGGFQSGLTSIASIISGLVGQDIVARTITLTATTGNPIIGGKIQLAGVGSISIDMVSDSNRISWPGGLFIDATAAGLRSNAGIRFSGAGGAFVIGSTMAITNTAPTVVAGAGASVTNSNGTAAFTIGLGGAAQTGTITLPTATTGWVCYMQNITTPASFVVGQTGGTTSTVTFTNYSRTTGAAINWNANDVMACIAMAY